MNKIDLIRSEMMAAMKAHDKPRKDALSLLLAALKNKAIDKRADLTEDEENQIILHEIKQSQETLESAPASRTEIIEECKTRIAVYTAFAPRQMSPEEIGEAIEGVLKELGIGKPTPKDKGTIMKTLMPLVKGKADGRMVNDMLGKLFQ